MPGPPMHLLPVSPSDQSQPQGFHPTSDPLHLTNIGSTDHHTRAGVSQPCVNLVHQRMQRPRRHPHHGSRHARRRPTSRHRNTRHTAAWLWVQRSDCHSTSVLLQVSEHKTNHYVKGGFLPTLACRAPRPCHGSEWLRPHPRSDGSCRFPQPLRAAGRRRVDAPRRASRWRQPLPH